MTATNVVRVFADDSVALFQHAIHQRVFCVLRLLQFLISDLARFSAAGSECCVSVFVKRAADGGFLEKDKPPLPFFMFFSVHDALKSATAHIGCEAKSAPIAVESTRNLA